MHSTNISAEFLALTGCIIGIKDTMAGKTDLIPKLQPREDVIKIN